MELLPTTVFKPNPYYLTRIETSDGEVIVECESPKPSKRVLPAEESEIMIEMMQSVVDSGTARRLSLPIRFVQ